MTMCAGKTAEKNRKNGKKGIIQEACSIHVGWNISITNFLKNIYIFEFVPSVGYTSFGVLQDYIRIIFKMTLFDR